MANNLNPVVLHFSFSRVCFIVLLYVTNSQIYISSSFYLGIGITQNWLKLVVSVFCRNSTSSFLPLEALFLVVLVLVITPQIVVFLLPRLPVPLHLIRVVSILLSEKRVEFPVHAQNVLAIVLAGADPQDLDYGDSKYQES